ncbi:hypothetical protein RB195_025866 [Necator americanus]|uniref:Transporter, major facilitator family protein n=1 Tax=Necator americanus TaxID=51031 RepID=A0ABR1EWC1_NECAM
MAMEEILGVDDSDVNNADDVSPLLMLPMEIILMVLLRADFVSIMRLKVVCRKINALITKNRSRLARQFVDKVKIKDNSLVVTRGPPDRGRTRPTSDELKELNYSAGERFLTRYDFRVLESADIRKVKFDYCNIDEDVAREWCRYLADNEVMSDSVSFYFCHMSTNSVSSMIYVLTPLDIDISCDPSYPHLSAHALASNNVCFLEANTLSLLNTDINGEDIIRAKPGFLICRGERSNITCSQLRNLLADWFEGNRTIREYIIECSEEIVLNELIRDLPIREIRPNHSGNMRKKSLNVEDIGCLTTRTRYIILFLGSACISSIASNMVVLNFTLICMGREFNETNPIDLENRGPYDYTQSEKSILMWAVAVGTLTAAWPFHWFYQKYGARYVFFTAGLISTVSTAVMPFTAGYSWLAFIVARFFQGVSFGADFAAIGLIVVHWASLKQHGLFISLLSSFSQISVIFTMPIAGELCVSSFGWPSVYYVHAAVSGVLFAAWLFYYRNTPAKHPAMTEIELEKIQRGKGEVKEKEDTPIKAIMTNHIMWSVWLSAFGELMMSQFIVMYGPTYLKEVLGFRVAETGYFVAIPRALHLAFKIISGIASDRIQFLSEKVKMRIFNTIALMVSGSFFCVLGFLPRDLANYALASLLIIECSTGFICGGFYKCATLVARQHSHFVLSQIQFIKCLSLFIEPLLVFLICKHNSLTEWRVVFLFHGVLLIVGNIIFCYFATDKPAAFTIRETKESAEEKSFSA